MPPANGATSAPLHPQPLTLDSEPSTLPTRIANESGDDISTCSSYNLDSIDMRRRHGVYLHRPPVWFPRPCSYRTSSATSRSDDAQPEKEAFQHIHQSDGICPICGTGLDLYGSCTCQSAPSDLFRWRETPAWDPSGSTLIDDGHESDLARPVDFVPHAGASQNPERHIGEPIDIGLSEMYRISLMMPPEEVLEDNHYYQRKVALCTRLQSYCDIRCPPDEPWAMQEGSLVVGIQPLYVGGMSGHNDESEFELRLGRVYVILAMYADLWALCVDVSFDMVADNIKNCHKTFNIGFLPLCAVTLPCNLGAFFARCGGPFSSELEIEPAHPWNGQVVVPPKRSYSLTAAAEIRQPGYQLLLQPLTQEILKNISLLSGAEDSAVPLDAPVKDLIARLSNGTKGPSWLQKILKRWEIGAKTKPFVSNRPCSRPNARDTAQRPSSPAHAASSTRSEEEQPGGMSRSQYERRAVSRNFKRLLGFSKKQASPE